MLNCHPTILNCRLTQSCCQTAVTKLSKIQVFKKPASTPVKIKASHELASSTARVISIESQQQQLVLSANPLRGGGGGTLPSATFFATKKVILGTKNAK